MAKTALSWLKRLSVTVFVMAALIHCFFMDFFLVLTWSGQRLAYRLAPPEYPGSRLVGQHVSGGTATMWDRRIYRSFDSYEGVLAYMEQHMPGFAETTLVAGRSAYINHACDDSLLARSAGWLADSGQEGDGLTLPRTRVLVYEGPDVPTETIITVWVEWPTR